MKHQWLVRPSQMGALMSKGRTKDKAFGDTAMKVIQEAVLLHKYNVEAPEINTKEMDKGTFNESKNIEIASQVLGWQNVDANAPKIRKVNNWFIGEPDVNTDTLLADIKSSWSAQTFPFFKDPDNKTYYAQLQAYMDLTGKQEAELVYVLSSHPEHIIASEVKRLTYYYADRPHLFKVDGIEELWTMAEEKATEQVNKESNVDRIPVSKRVKRFIIKRDDDFINQMHERVEEARKIFDELIETI